MPDIDLRPGVSPQGPSPNLKIVGISRVKNEIDIIEAFVRHHAAMFDELIVLDDGSSDGTFEILNLLQREGLPLIVLQDASIGYDQSSYITKFVATAVYELGADWVFPLDADEFIEPPTASSLRAVLAAWGPRLLHVGWSNFLWRRDHDESAELNPVLRLADRLPPRGDNTKVAIPSAVVRSRNFTVSTGAHHLILDGHVQGVEICDAFHLCHFPVRSVDQFAAKILISFLQFRSWREYRAGTAIQYDAPYEAMKDGLPAFESAMEAAALRYGVAHDVESDTRAAYRPFGYMGGPLRFTERPKPFLSSLLHHVEAMAGRIRDLSLERSSTHLALRALTPQITDAGSRERIEVIAGTMRSMSEEARARQIELAASVSRQADLMRDHDAKLDAAAALCSERLLTAERTLADEIAFRAAAERAAGLEAERREAAERALEEARRQRDEVARAHRLSEAAQARMRGTLSWRITAPLRRIRRRAEPTTHEA